MFTVLKSFVGRYVRNSIPIKFLIRYDSVRQLSLIVDSKTRNIKQNQIKNIKFISSGSRKRCTESIGYACDEK